MFDRKPTNSAKPGEWHKIFILCRNLYVGNRHCHWSGTRRWVIAETIEACDMGDGIIHYCENDDDEPSLPELAVKLIGLAMCALIALTLAALAGYGAVTLALRAAAAIGGA